MWLNTRKNNQPPVNMAALPGHVAAVQFFSDTPEGKPRLRQASVVASTHSADARLDEMARHLKLRGTPLRILCEPADYQFLQTEIPSVPAEELNSAIRWQVKDQLRSPLANVTLAVAAPPDTSHGLRRPSGYVVAAENNFLRNRMLQFRAYNAEVTSIGIPEFAQLNIADLIEASEHATAVLSITPNGCLLTTSREGVLYFSRNFELSTLTLASSESVRRDQFDRLVLELQRSIDVLEHQFSFLAVSTLWISPFAHCDELLSLLIDTLYLPVKIINLAEVFDCSATQLPENLDQQSALFHVLGLGLEAAHPGHTHIHLCNPALLPPKPFFQFKTMVIGLAIFAAALVATHQALRYGIQDLEKQAQASQVRQQAKQEQISKLEQKIAQRQHNPRIASEMTQAQEERKQLQQITATLQTGSTDTRQPSFAASLYDLAHLPVSGVWLKQIDIQGDHIALQGLATQAEEIPKYLNALNQLPAFKGQRFSAFEIVRPANTPASGTAAPLAFRLDSSVEEKKP